MIEQILEKRNLNRAFTKVVANKGSGGVDGLQVSDLKAHLQTHGETLVEAIRTGKYQPQPIKGIKVSPSRKAMERHVFWAYQP